MRPSTVQFHDRRLGDHGLRRFQASSAPSLEDFGRFSAHCCTPRSSLVHLHFQGRMGRNTDFWCVRDRRCCCFSFPSDICPLLYSMVHLGEVFFCVVFPFTSPPPHNHCLSAPVCGACGVRLALNWTVLGYGRGPRRLQAL